MDGKGTEVFLKSSNLDHGIVGSLNKELDFRLWHSGWQGNGSLNKEFDFRSWHCGRQGGEKLFTMALCKGKGGEVQIKT